MTAREIVDHMLKNDAFSQWLDIKIIELHPGFCKLQASVKRDMLNGHGIAHGGITYSLSDSALAFASNAHGQKCVSIETSISHLEAVREGDTLTSTCTEHSRGKTIGVYTVETRNQEEKLVSKFKGTVHISRESW